MVILLNCTIPFTIWLFWRPWVVYWANLRNYRNNWSIYVIQTQIPHRGDTNRSACADIILIAPIRKETLKKFYVKSWIPGVQYFSNFDHGIWRLYQKVFGVFIQQVCDGYIVKVCGSYIQQVCGGYIWQVCGGYIWQVCGGYTKQVSDSFIKQVNE